MKAYRDCKYAAFISYAHDDDKRWDWWVTDFSEQVETSLSTALRKLHGPDNPAVVHLSGKNGPVSGVLPNELKERIAESFAMIIVVHENYADSDWCLEELQYFHSLLGERGFLERLYIVALSQTSIRDVEQKATWKALCPKDQIWIQFFRDADKTKPVRIRGNKRLTEEFSTSYERLIDDLIAKIKADADKPARSSSSDRSSATAGAVAPAGMTAAGGAEDQGEGVRIYIESNQHSRQLWMSLGEQIKKKWDDILKDAQIHPPLYVRPRGLPVDQLDQHPHLDDADGVVLFWGIKEPNALISQIRKVEDKLSGRDVAPGIVAYLIPPQPDPGNPMLAWGWNVLRFDAKTEAGIDVVPQEAGDLDRFLRQVLKRKAQRRGVNTQ